MKKKMLHRWIAFVSAFALFLALGFLPATAAGETDVVPEPLPVEQAFALSSKVLDDAIVLEWRMPKGYYLYRNRFSLGATNAANALGALQWPAGQQHVDPQFGRVTVFYDQAQLRVPIRKSASLPSKLDINVTFQGCLENSACYPPTTRRLAFDLPPAFRQDTEFAGANGFSWRWLAVLLAAFAGGLVLNLMPCVLPILSLKVLSVLHAADDEIGARGRALAYTAGVM
ncbi:MAG TPA: protein-disulfide reductase DsbD domain-containing protein, partial [Lysobacter sp.]|nr:protein-disulfide reductase DsbD domain-containing protein [Lysobacter sp.]